MSDKSYEEQVLQSLESAFDYISECFKQSNAPELMDPRPEPNEDEIELLEELKSSIEKTKGRQNEKRPSSNGSD